MKCRYLFFVIIVLTVLTSAARVYGQDEFKQWKDEEVTSQDEFKDFTDSSYRDEQKDSGNMISKNSGTTNSIDSGKTTSINSGKITSMKSGNENGFKELNNKTTLKSGHKHDSSNTYWVLGIMGFTVAAGFLSKYSKGRQLRLFFLIASVAIIGFYRSACPCPISGFQEVLLFSMGGPLHPVRLLWFALLLPITYLFGRVWCGWVCHLGALQELVNFNGRFNFLGSTRAQSIMRYSRISILIILIVQLVITKTILWEEIDPFKAIFNLFASESFTWILVALLLISSVLIYRPFCKTVCPVGLVLGWISKIPGASIIAARPNCVGCKLCDNACRINAITKTSHTVSYDKESCIACGECIDSCKHKALNFGNNKKPSSTETFNSKT